MFEAICLLVKAKAKFTLEQAMKSQMGSWVVNATPRPLYPREWPGTRYTGGWVSPRAGLGMY